jgi:hypothetical protein
MQVRLICHLVSGEQVEILSDKEQGLEEAYHAGALGVRRAQDRQWPSPRWRLRADDAGSVMYVEIREE